jgi:hypothetical protein
MAASVYVLGTLITIACCILLLRGFARTGMKLLLWSGICFLGLSISNFLVFADLVLFPEVDLYYWRLLSASIGMMVLVYGLIWEGES